MRSYLFIRHPKNNIQIVNEKNFLDNKVVLMSRIVVLSTLLYFQQRQAAILLLSLWTRECQPLIRPLIQLLHHLLGPHILHLATKLKGSKDQRSDLQVVTVTKQAQTHNQGFTLSVNPYN